MGRPRKDAGAAAILDNAEEHVNELIAQAPNGIPTITGGMTGSEIRENPTRREQTWIVKVMENDLPYAKDWIPVSYMSRAGAYKKEFRANTEVELTESAIRTLEDAVYLNERVVVVEPGKTFADVERMNPSMKIIERSGRFFLQEERPRFTVQRIRMVQR